MNRRILLTIIIACVAIGLAPFLGEDVEGDASSFVFWDLRVPRTLLGCMVGAVLGLTGAVYQTLFSNPLAVPSTVGTTAGASLGVLVALVLLPGTDLASSSSVTTAAFLGALVVTLLIAAVASTGRARVNDILLVGIGITLAAGALTTGIQFQADMNATFQAVRWSLGSLAKVGYQDVLGLAPFVLITVIGLLSQMRGLGAISGGEERAYSQGVHVVRVRTLCLGLGALGVGACVAVCGPIAFVGLLVPHLVRITLGARRSVLLPMSALVGAAFLCFSDGLARWALPDRNLPVGVITAALGAPALIALVFRRRP